MSLSLHRKFTKDLKRINIVRSRIIILDLPIHGFAQAIRRRSTYRWFLTYLRAKSTADLFSAMMLIGVKSNIDAKRSVYFKHDHHI